MYKVEKWSRDGQHVERMLFAGNSLDRAREIFQSEVRRRPRGRYTPILAASVHCNNTVAP